METFELKKTFVHRGSPPKQVIESATIRVEPGEKVGLVGPSGCGKSTLALMIMKLLEPTSGRISIDGEDITGIPERMYRKERGKVQMISQNPYASVDPMRSIKWSIDEAYGRYGGVEDYESLLKSYSLPVNILNRRPNTLSGGELQRIAIIRALASDPKYLILDEATSMLDVSLQASILKMILDKFDGPDRGILMISHDSALIDCVCDRVYVLENGICTERRKRDGHI